MITSIQTGDKSMSFLLALLVGIGLAKLLALPAALGVMIGIYVYFKSQHQTGFRFQSDFNWERTYQANSSQIATYHHNLFALMGYIAKADGIVTKQEIQVAENIMSEMGMNYSQKNLAKSSFKTGSQGLNLANITAYLTLLKLNNPKDVDIFFSTVERIVYADTHPRINQLNILNQIKFRLYQDNQHQQAKTQFAPNKLGNAYRTLGINSKMSYNEMKRAYQRLVGKHHPDRARTDAEREKAEAYIKTIQSAWKIVKEHQKETV